MMEDDEDASASGAAPTPAGPAAAGAGGTGSSVQPIATPATATIPQQATPQFDSAAQAAPPPPPKPMSRFQSGLADIFGDLADSLAGKNRETVYRDADGNRVVGQVPMTRGQQLAKLAGEAIRGAGAGAGAAPGPGQKLRALGAGVQAGINYSDQQKQQQEALSDEDFKAKQEAMQQKANLHLLGIKTATAQFQLSDSETKAAEGAADRMNTTAQFLEDNGAKPLGTFKTMDEVAKFQQNDADAVKDHVNGRVFTNLRYDKDGHADGFELYRLPPDVAGQKTEKDMEVPMLVPGVGADGKPDISKPPTVGSYTVPAGSVTKAQAAAVLQAANEKIAGQQVSAHKQAEEDRKTEAQAAEAAANAAAKPGEARAMETADYARADASRSEAAKNRGDLGGDSTSLVDAIGSGHVAAKRLDYLMSRNPTLLQQVIAKYPDFDSSKAAAYPDVYEQFTSTKPNTAGGQLNAGAAAMKHLHDLSELNTPASHVWGTNAYTAYQNKLDTVVSELGKFYGNDTIPALAGYRKTLDTTLPGNRDAAIQTQARSMGQKFDNYEQQWRNAAPSKAYEAPMPQVDDGAKAARAALDPEYKQRLQGNNAAQPAVNKANAVQPGEHTATGAHGETLVVRGGQWVPASQ
jgi:hypothetical protein